MSRAFNSTSICYYSFNMDMTGVPVGQRNFSQIWVQVWSYSNVYVHLNNGTVGQRKLANNPLQVNPLNTGMFFNYTAWNNTLYVVVVGADVNPFVNLSVSFYQPPVILAVQDSNSTDDDDVQVIY